MFFFERKPLILFFSSFIIAAFFWREPEAIVDSSRYFTQAKHLALYGAGYFIREWGSEIRAWTDQPVVPFLYGLLFKFFGESRLPVQIFTTALFSATAVLTYLTGKALWDEETGFLGGWLLLAIPYLFTQAPLMLVDIPTMAFFMCSVFMLIRALQAGGAWRAALAGFFMFITLFSKYSAGLMLSVLGIIFVVFLAREPDRRRAIIRRGVAVFAVAGLFSATLVMAKFEVFASQIKLIASFQMPGLKTWKEGFVSTFLFQSHPFVAAAALYSVYVAIKKKDLTYAVIAWLLLVVALTQINRIRYIIMVFPMLSLMAAYGLREIKDMRLRRFFALCAVISSITLAAGAFLPFLQRQSTANIREAGLFLNSLEAGEAEVFTLPSDSPANPAVHVAILDLFTSKKILYEYEDPYALTGLPEAIRKSSLRFTWEYKNPRYYAEKSKEERPAVVVISPTPEFTPPAAAEQRIKHFSRRRQFAVSTRLFRHHTFVTVYAP